MRRGLLAIAAAAVLLAGCATAALPGGPGVPKEPSAPDYGAVPLVPLTHPDVLAYCPDAPAGHLEVAGAEVVEVYRCTTRLGMDGASGEEHVTRLAGDSGALLDAYAADDVEGPDDLVCSLEMRDPVILWLGLASGDTIAIRAPVDGCGKPQQAAEEAVAAATFETVLSRPLG